MKYIYLFPDSGAMGNYQSECRKFGCEFLGKNRFQGERNLVIRGELSDLKRYAKWLDYELHPGYLYKENDFGGDIEDEACKDDEIEGIYECKNNEVIEVRYDDKYKNYRFTFQKGGSPIILPKEEGKKLLRQYQAVKYQDSVKDSYSEEAAKYVASQLKGECGPFGGENPRLNGSSVTLYSQGPEETYTFTEDGKVIFKGKKHDLDWLYDRSWFMGININKLKSILNIKDSYEDACKDSKQYEYIDSDKVNEAELKSLCRANHVELTKLSGEYRLYGELDDIEYVLDSLGIELNDACKDSIYINGTLKDFNPRELVEKVKQRQENLHTNRIDKSGKVHTIFIDAHGLVENPSLLYVDVITQDTKGDNQERVLMKRCKDWEEAIQVMENYKRQHMNDACKDETPYQKQYNGLQKELKKMDSIHKAIKAYKQFKDSKVKDSEFENNLDKLSRYGVKYREVSNDRSYGIAYEITYEKYLTGQSILELAKKFGKHLISHQPGRIIVGDSKVKDKSIVKGNGEVHFFYERGFVKTYAWDRNKIHKDNNKWEELYNYAKSLNCNIETDDYDYIVIKTRQGNESNLCKVFNKINPNYSTSELMNLLKDSKKVKDIRG